MTFFRTESRERPPWMTNRIETLLYITTKMIHRR